MEIRSTHVGSLIRPPELLVFEAAMGRGESYDEAAYAETLRPTVADVVARQDRGRHRHRQRRRVRQGQLDQLPLRPDQRRRVARDPRRRATRLPPSRDRLRVPGRVRAARQGVRCARSARPRCPVPAPSVWVCTGPVTYDRDRASTATSRTSRPRCRARTSRASCPSSRRRARTGWRTSTTGRRRSSSTRSPTRSRWSTTRSSTPGLMLQVDDARAHARVRLDPRRGRLDRGLPQAGPSCGWTR